jgi:hypothetical protein
MKKIFLLLFIVSTITVRAQNVAGYWYGTANVSGTSTNNYLIELIIKQNSSAVQGIINYYFRNSFRSIKLNGSYDSRTRQLSLYNIPLPYFASTDQMQVDCAMNFIATHRIAIAGSNLIGRFVGQDAYKYTCPELFFDLKLNKDAGNQDSVLTALRNFKETHQLWTPSATDTMVQATVYQRKIENLVLNREFLERESIVQNEIEVESDSLHIDFYDNGEVDGDSISVFFNDQLYGANLRLSTKSIRLDLRLDSSREVNTLAMFANNLGSIPPNTALMLLFDGKKRYELRLSSSLEKNGAIRIRRKKTGK